MIYSVIFSVSITAEDPRHQHLIFWADGVPMSHSAPLVRLPATVVRAFLPAALTQAVGCLPERIGGIQEIPSELYNLRWYPPDSTCPLEARAWCLGMREILHRFELRAFTA